MKLLTSYNSSPTSSSTVSFDPTLCQSKSATAGCLTGILRRILCSGGLPAQPSDQIREVDSMVSGNDQELKAKQKIEATTYTTTTTTLSIPGIVARLMGLESMGEIPSESTASSLSRSRSMNCVDCLGECKRMQGLHRRVKSTSSFREVPTFHLLENENFLVLSFESGGESKEFKSNGRKREMGSAELKQKRAERREFKENKRDNVYDEKILIEKGKLSKRVSDMSSVSAGNDGKLQEITNTSPLFEVSSEKKYIDSEAAKFLQSMNRKEVTNGEKLKRRKKRTMCYTEKKIEIECSSEDSSPVSVLDFEREARTKIDSFAVGLSTRRKLSPELENDQLFLLHSDGNLMFEERKVKEIDSNKYERSKRKEKQSQEYIDIWGEICRLAEDELVDSYQIRAPGMRQNGDFESICADFESEIFDYLLNELIDQLVWTSHENSATSKVVK